MVKLFLLALTILMSTNPLFGENNEISKKLLHAQKIDNQNEKLGESIDPEVRLQLIKFLSETDQKNFMLYSGFEFLENEIEKDTIKLFYRAYVDSSFYSEEQIKEVKDFLFKDRVFFCKTKDFRKTLFLLDIQFEFLVIDKLNKPFINFEFNKETCREVEPFGRDRALTEWDVKRLIKKLNKVTDK